MEAVGVSKQFGAVQALCDVDVAIAPGELVGLVGDNGAGKTTLVKALSGVLRPTSGQIRWEGRDVRLDSPIGASDLGIETVYQDLGLCENLTVAENIYLGREPTKGRGLLRRLDKRRMSREVEEVLSALSVNVPPPDTKVAELSGGQRQAVAVSRCRLWQRRLVLMDEPTAALGVQEGKRVVRAIRDLSADGVAILIISHDIPLVRDLAERVVVLRKGRKAADVRTKDVSEHEVVALITGAEEGLLNEDDNSEEEM